MEKNTGSRIAEERQDFGYYLSNISHSIQQYFNRLYDQVGITYPQSRLLTYLYRKEDQAEKGEPNNVNQRELERALGIKASSVSSLVRNLEAKGFIKSERIESDTRNKRILLTEKAYEIDAVIAQAVDETEKALTGGMSQEEVSTLLGLLRVLMDNVKALSDDQE